MVGSVASSSARSNQGDDRFYQTPARRKQQQQQLELQQQQQQQHQQQQQQHQQQLQHQQMHQQPPPHQLQQQQMHQQPPPHQLLHQPPPPPLQQQQQNHHHQPGPRHHRQHLPQQPRTSRQRVKAPMAVAAAAAAAAAASVEAREVESRAAESDDSGKQSRASLSAPMSSTAASSSVASSPSPPPRPPTPQGNLTQLIHSVTPFVNAKYLIKPGPRAWKNTDQRVPYYVLHDLWDTFSEWSAYGAGVPILLDGTDTVIQYYVPYLSAIQLYVNNPSKSPNRTTRCPVENSDGDLYRDTSSEGSNEGGADRRSVHINEGNRRLTDRLSRVSLGEQANVNLEGSSSDDGEAQNSPGLLKFEYLERESPYGREPLTEKISILARRCPELNTIKSYELLPSSWLSVAWYPIYRIPTGPTLRDLESCFLTFHLLATPCKSIKNGYQDSGASSSRTSSSSFDGSTRIALPVLGLASYKFRDSVWITNGLCEREQVSSLLQAADKWVQGLQVDHPDFRFFMSHSAHYWR